MTIFITSVSGSINLPSFTNRFFHCRRQPGLSLVFDAAERMENLTTFSAREVKRAAAEEREREEDCSAKGQRIGGAQTLRNKSEKNLFSGILIPT